MQTVDYTPELIAKVMDNMADYHQTGETVCGAEDPAVISLLQPLPEFEGCTVVRVLNRYVNPWKSDTFLQFSNEEITEFEYSLYEELADERMEG